MLTWDLGQVRSLPLDAIDERYRCYRLQVAAADEEVFRSFQRHGQLVPAVVCLREETTVMIDGFARLNAARRTPGMRTLVCRLIEADERLAKAAIYVLNGQGRRLRELEEAWIVQALVRQDGLSQVQVAELLGHHKSWVCRRLALLEKLSEETREELRLGLLSPTAARPLTRLPAGNQAAVVATLRRESLSAAEVSGVVDLLLAAGTREQEQFVLEKPREALRESRGALPQAAWDPRLSTAGNRLARQLAWLLDALTRMESCLRYRSRGELALCDRGPLIPGLQKLVRDARLVAEVAEDFLPQIQLP